MRSTLTTLLTALVFVTSAYDSLAKPSEAIELTAEIPSGNTAVSIAPSPCRATNNLSIKGYVSESVQGNLLRSFDETGVTLGVSAFFSTGSQGSRFNFVIPLPTSFYGDQVITLELLHAAQGGKLTSGKVTATIEVVPAKCD